jgi:hypothetical protein
MNRLLSLVGTPSPLFYATLNVVRALAKVGFSAHDVICANTVAELSEQIAGLPRTPNRGVVLYSDYPQPDMLPAYVATDAPLAVCVDDFVTIAHYSVVSRDYGGVEAARFASMGLVNIEPLMVSPPRSSLMVADSPVQLDVLVAGLAQLYGLTVDDEMARIVLEELGAEGGDSLATYALKSLPPLESARAALDRRGPLESELIDALAPQYDPIARGEPLENLEWPPFALLRPDFPDRLTVGSIDLTGPARFIYYGPYFALPKGRWRAELTIEVAECLSDNQIAIDVVSGDVLAEFRTQLPPQGVYGCEIAFEIVKPSNPVEIRLQLVTGAIEGVLMLHGVRLRRSTS